MNELILAPARTALVTIDLQAFSANMPVQPHEAQDVIVGTGALAKEFRTAGALILQVVASLGVGGGVAIARAEQADRETFGGALPPGWDAIPAELGPEPADVIVTKWGWDAFHGTDLDLQLRRRGIDTLVLAGMATNIGVESTARSAYERGYGLVFAEDLLSAFSENEHTTTLESIFSRIGRVRTSAQIVRALKEAD